MEVQTQKHAILTVNSTAMVNTLITTAEYLHERIGKLEKEADIKEHIEPLSVELEKYIKRLGESHDES